VGFSEVTGGRALSFRNVSMGETAGPNMFWGNAEGAKLPCRYVVEKTSSRALELKKSLSSLRKNELRNALRTLVLSSLSRCDIFIVRFPGSSSSGVLHITERYWRDLGHYFFAGITRFVQNFQSHHSSASFAVDFSA
jgi:hypothetical protein